MAGRIRSIKPEILEDEKTAALSHLEWRLFVSLWLIADDYGNLRGDAGYIQGQTLWATVETKATVAGALTRIELVGLLERYSVRGQTYFHIQGWSKHQKVEKPGKPRMPGPSEADPVRSQAFGHILGTPERVSGDCIDGLSASSSDNLGVLSPDLRPNTNDHDPENVCPPARARDPASCATTEPPPPPTPSTVSPPVPVTTAAREFSERRRKLFWTAWRLAGEAFSRVQASGIDVNAPNGWTGNPDASSTPVKGLWEIIDGMLVGDKPNFDRAELRLANRILVAEAEARAFTPPTTKYMTPARIWNRNSFDIAVDMSPEQASSPRSSPVRALPRSSAGRAPVLHEHPRLQEQLAKVARLKAEEAEAAKKAQEA